MNPTVAVALITALSTLAAAGLAALVSARTTARQLRHQAALAREERAEQRAAARREARGLAYEQFLGRVDAAYRVLDEGWTARPFAEPLPWQAGFTARRAVDEALIRVQLTGPEEVAGAGRAVVRGLAEEFRTHAGAVGERATFGAGDQRESGHEVPLSAVELAPDARSAALRVRFATSRRFVAAARAALDGDGDGTDGPESAALAGGENGPPGPSAEGEDAPREDRPHRAQ
ncbi:hypothetical protein HUT18_04905 [Streptomyces sp. NA04227]|uniref:hypothetical protein n=1 Tax=Streptomyces sp. NA04227 TaxID=2742136 RepID=UPI0015922B22|nr:hypothetical protein [Streptomyces sp. NA04227]QKW05819.1 hypothetical protein HUT18_04905 [Streptomyces sp. NA04227]